MAAFCDVSEVAGMASVLLGTDDGVRVLGGDTALHGQAVDWLAAGGGTLWALAATALWRDPLGAGEQIATWAGPRLNCLAAGDGGLWAGTAEAHLLRWDGVALSPVDAFDAAGGRDGWYTPWGGPPDVRSIAVAADGTVHVNVHVGGIVRSRDRGRTWAPTIDVDADVHQVATVPGEPGHVLAATAEGLATSDDGGDTWTFATAGMHASYCRAVAVAGDTLLVSCSTGPGGDRAALYRRPLAEPATALERCGGGLPEWFGGNLDTGCVAGAGSEAAFGTRDGRVFASADSGRTWEQVAGGLPPVRCLLLT